MLDPYKELGIDPTNPTDESIHEAYKKAVHRHPPDRDPEKFERIQQAYELIKTDDKRTAYNIFGMECKEGFEDKLPKETKRPQVDPELWINMIKSEANRMRDS